MLDSATSDSDMLGSDSISLAPAAVPDAALSYSDAVPHAASPLVETSQPAQCRRRRKPRRRRQPASRPASIDRSASDDIAAASDAVTLRPAVLLRSVFISRVHPDTTESDIAGHVSSHIGIQRDLLSCRRIDRLRNEVGSFSASFKIIVPDALFNAVVSPDIWPNGTVVREFVPRRPSESRADSKNVLAKLPSTTPT